MARSQVKFTPDVVDQIVAAVLAGNYVSTASAAAGIHRATYYSWMKRGEQASDARANAEPLGVDDEGFADFYDRVSQATAQAEMDAVADVREGKSVKWVAAMTYLERRAPEKWGRREGRNAKPETVESFDDIVRNRVKTADAA